MHREITNRKQPTVGKWADKLRSLLRLRPSFGLRLATAVAALLVVQSALALTGAAQPAQLSPAGVLLAVEEQATLAYAWAARLASDVRLVYEIRALLEADNVQASSPVPAATGVLGSVTACTLSTAPKTPSQKL